MSKPILMDNDLHKIVSNLSHSTENAFIESVKPEEDTETIVTFPEKASTQSKLVQRERFITPIPPRPAAYLQDAAAASYGTRKSLEVVIGDDDREQVLNTLENPWRQVAALRIRASNGKTYAGTGWFISPTLRATAGHCVYMHEEGGWPVEIEVIPALNGTERPFDSVKSTKFESNNGWINDRNSDYDYGVIILDEPVSLSIGYFSFAAPPDNFLKSNIANISGYPTDLDRATRQYYHAREITRASSRRLYYEIDTYGGQSGSPIWMNLGEGERVAIGIHTTGSSTSNFGTRITEEIFNNLRTWKNLYS
jgi:glutamyl endopeptidase